MNESVEAMPFPLGGGPLVGRKRRALSTLCILIRAGFALALGLSLVSDPAMVLSEFSYKPNPSGQLLIERLAGVWITVWGLYTIYVCANCLITSENADSEMLSRSLQIAGLGGVGDKKANAVLNFLGTLACIFIASQVDPPHTSNAPSKRGAVVETQPLGWDLTQVYLTTGFFTLVTDGVTFVLCGAGPRVIKISENSFIRLNTAEDSFKNNLLSGNSDGDVTVIKRINSHTQLFSTAPGVDKKKK